MIIGSSRVVEARNAVSILAVLRSGNGFGAVRQGSRDADVAGSGVSPSSRTVSLSWSMVFSSRMMSSKDLEKCEDFAIDA